MKLYVVTEEYYWDYQQYVTVFETKKEAEIYLSKVKDRTDRQIHWREQPEVYDYEDVMWDNPNEFRIDCCCDIIIWEKELGKSDFPRDRHMHALK